MALGGEEGVEHVKKHEKKISRQTQGTLAAWIWSRFLSEYFINLLIPQPHFLVF